MENESNAKIQLNSLGMFFCFISVPDFIYGLYCAGNGMEIFGVMLMFSSLFFLNLGLYNLLGKKGPIGFLYVIISGGLSFLLTEIITYPIFKLNGVFNLSLDVWKFYYLVLFVGFLLFLYIVKHRILGHKLGDSFQISFLEKITAPIKNKIPKNFL
jgi:hypothetical protein